MGSQSFPTPGRTSPFIFGFGNVHPSYAVPPLDPATAGALIIITSRVTKANIIPQYRVWMPIKTKTDCAKNRFPKVLKDSRLLLGRGRRSQESC